jgi:crossover junction endodeoxyribonuclease RuvC
MGTLRVLGIDPGLKGALAWLDTKGGLHEVEDMPTLAGVVNANLLSSLIPSYGPLECVVVETQQAYPKQGVSSSFKTGVGFGIIIGVVAGLNLPVYYWHSSQWKRILHLSNDKELSRKKALERWPHRLDDFKLKKHEGRAEAALLAASWLRSEDRGAFLTERYQPKRPRKLVRLR